MKRRLLLLFIAAWAVIIGAYIVMHSSGSKNPDKTNTTAATTQPSTNRQSDQTTFNKSRYSLNDPASIWVIVNKQRPLQPKTYIPDDLVIPSITLRSNITSDERQVRKVNADALQTMAAAAKKDGVTLTLESGYRSYNFQVSLYNRYVQEQGKAVADTQSARPGFSEHQTGLAADVGGISKPSCNVEQCFADTIEGRWLAANAWKYGYVIRYPEGKDAVTGYEYEPWHVRYVGTDLSTEMHKKGITTLEEFFGLPAAPDYN